MSNNRKRYTYIRKLWFVLNQPDKEGNYTCALCLIPLSRSEVTLDHIKPRRFHPELRCEITNLQPAHEKCNLERGIFFDKLIRNPDYASMVNKERDVLKIARMQRYLAGVQ